MSIGVLKGFSECLISIGTKNRCIMLGTVSALQEAKIKVSNNHRPQQPVSAHHNLGAVSKFGDDHWPVELSRWRI